MTMTNETMKKDLDPKKISDNATITEIIDAYNDLADKFTFLSTKMSLNNFDGQIVEVELQAGEEKNPGGAKILIDNGLLSKYKINKNIT